MNVLFACLLCWTYQSLWLQFPLGGIAVLSAKKNVGLCRPSSFLLSFTRLHNSIDNDNNIVASNTITHIQTSSESEVNSVHLKLTQDYGTGDEQKPSKSTNGSTSTSTEEQTQQNTTLYASILQYISEPTGEVVVATLQDAGWEMLDHFAIHKLGYNLSITPGYSRREVYMIE